MTTDVLTTTPETEVIDVVKVLISHKISGLPVVDKDENIVGIITEKDLLNLVFDGHWHDITVGEVMTKDVVYFSPDDNIDLIALKISQRRFRRVPIVENKKVVGIVSRRDIICKALELCKELEKVK